jgi:hypothetical protein
MKALISRWLPGLVMVGACAVWYVLWQYVVGHHLPVQYAMNRVVVTIPMLDTVAAVALFAGLLATYGRPIPGVIGIVGGSAGLWWSFFGAHAAYMQTHSQADFLAMLETQLSCLPLEWYKELMQRGLDPESTVSICEAVQALAAG